MDQKKKNMRLLIVLAFLVLVSLALKFFPSNQKTTIENYAEFQIEDTAAVNKITIKSDQLDNVLLRTDSGWVINGSHKADENIMMVLLSVMKKVEIVRSVGTTQEHDISEQLDNEGILAQFYEGSELVQSFTAGANENQTMSIFQSKDDEYYVVQIPGYESFITGIFQISAIDWRNRLLVSVGPTTLNAMGIEYFQEPEESYEIEIEGNFPSIDGIENLDTLALMDYLDQFQYFQADQFIEPHSEPVYDSLSATQPWVKFTFDNFNLTGGPSITFFPQIKGDAFILGITRENQWALFSYNRISAIFKKKSAFDKNIKKPRR
mgnify:CR=1 FL=1